MKVCAQCNQQVNDNEDFCPRCGSSNLVSAQRMGGTAQRPPQQRPPQRPNPGYNQRSPQMQGQQRPNPQNMQRPQMNPQGQRVQSEQRPPQMQGQPGQRPPQMGGNPQRPPQQRPPVSTQKPVNNIMNDEDDFDLGFGEAEGKKSKKSKNVKEPKKPKVNPGSASDELLNDDVITVKDWIIFFIKMIIPILGLIVFIKTLIGSDNIPRSMTNYARASLIVSIVAVAISVICTMLLG